MEKQIPRHRTVADVMTATVHVASPSTSFRALVNLIEDNRVSAVPVVDQLGLPIGVVSESDLLLKERRTELESDGLWGRRRLKVKSHARIAADLMTSPAITVGVDTPIAEAARIMQERNVRRLIVVDGRGRIAGIVTRSDLLQVFLRSATDLRQEIVESIIPAVMPTATEAIDVQVESNVITLSGEVDRRTDSEILSRLARDVDGVVDVVNELTFRWDDTTPYPHAI
jgi:CBS domain-containing protein